MEERRIGSITSYLRDLLKDKNTIVLYAISKNFPSQKIQTFVQIKENIEWKIGFENDTWVSSGDYLMVEYPQIKYHSIDNLRESYNIIDPPKELLETRIKEMKRKNLKYDLDNYLHKLIEHKKCKILHAVLKSDPTELGIFIFIKLEEDIEWGEYKDYRKADKGDYISVKNKKFNDYLIYKSINEIEENYDIFSNYEKKYPCSY